jgi:hypothetical protein
MKTNDAFLESHCQYCLLHPVLTYEVDLRPQVGGTLWTETKRVCPRCLKVLKGYWRYHKKSNPPQEG